jgi:hypothetical protein
LKVWTVLVDVVQENLQFGFVAEPIGTHISRTIMLADLRLLLSSCHLTADIATYRQAVIEENVLHKRTVSTRRLSFKRLRELYILDKSILLFRALRDLWEYEPDAQPMLALLCAVARDPLLRSTVDTVTNLDRNSEITPQIFSAVVAKTFPDRYSEWSLASAGRNIASSWQQSGHLRGKLRKYRDQASCHSASVTYALLLGYISDARGEGLFETPWCILLDTPMHIIREKAAVAARQGWLEYRQTGGVTDVSFRYLLRENGVNGYE